MSFCCVIVSYCLLLIPLLSSCARLLCTYVALTNTDSPTHTHTHTRTHKLHVTLTKASSRPPSRALQSPSTDEQTMSAPDHDGPSSLSSASPLGNALLSNDGGEDIGVAEAHTADTAASAGELGGRPSPTPPDDERDVSSTNTPSERVYPKKPKLTKAERREKQDKERAAKALRLAASSGGRGGGRKVGASPTDATDGHAAAAGLAASASEALKLAITAARQRNGARLPHKVNVNGYTPQYGVT